MATFAGLLTSLAFGGMAFFTLVMAPLVFGKLGPDQGGRLMRDAFALYYPVMAGLTGLAAISAPPFWMGALLSLVASGFILAHLMLRPEINRLSDRRADGDAEAAGQFRRLHGLSQMLNLAQFLALFVVVFGMVNH
ncbi:DUF4149 domain-containing protein [Zavarzinia compransoris]|nr:DUF4149 domain-containing protein [Zavarzinia compransoris]TDP40429.1 uncharacterized protein DUF4149 [Zavarzinia compransoris]